MNKPPSPRPSRLSGDHIDYRTSPARYRHWQLSVRGGVARLELDVDEKGGLGDDYELKLNTYDLSGDIELADAVQRLRFEHPSVSAVVITSKKERVFSAGANIRMLAGASHHSKVNFCKFTNETRNTIEDATSYSGQRYFCALIAAAAGGGYELALATDHIILIDDGTSAVSLPEVPLLGVLPGTGGLTRLTDKRNVRRDRADFMLILCAGRTRRAIRSRNGLGHPFLPLHWGVFSDSWISPDGDILTQEDWHRSENEWLPTDADKTYLRTLMSGPVHEPGRFAQWIAPPSRGINHQPVDFEYVRFD